MTSKALLLFCKKAYRNFKQQRKKENSVRVFRESKPRVFGGRVSFFTVEGEQQPTPNAMRKQSAAATMIGVNFRQAPMIDVLQPKRKAANLGDPHVPTSPDN
jgi:hypothetical protein